MIHSGLQLIACYSSGHIIYTLLLNKMQQQKRFLFNLIILSTALVSTNKGAEAQNHETKAGIFYSITGNGLDDTSYLFGTYHLVNNSFLNETPNMYAAFNKAKGVVVEMVLDSSQLQLVQSIGISSDKKLTDLLGQPFLDSLDGELKSNLGAGVAQMNQLKPINITLTLSMVYLMKNNAAVLSKFTGVPIDGYFATTGKEMGKIVSPLETLEQQMNILFNSTSADQQVSGLQSFLRNKEITVSLGDELLEKWLTNDLMGLQNVYLRMLALSGEEDYFIKDRNRNWIKVIPDLIKKESQFIAVGALHLPGKDGMIHLLREKGFTVTPIKL